MRHGPLNLSLAVHLCIIDEASLLWRWLVDGTSVGWDLRNKTGLGVRGQETICSNGCIKIINKGATKAGHTKPLRYIHRYKFATNQGAVMSIALNKGPDTRHSKPLETAQRRHGSRPGRQKAAYSKLLSRVRPASLFG